MNNITIYREARKQGYKMHTFEREEMAKYMTADNKNKKRFIIYSCLLTNIIMRELCFVKKLYNMGIFIILSII